MNYKRCEYCRQLIDPIEEFHIHEEHSYRGR